MTNDITCPVCHQPVESGSNSCAYCGFQLIGSTQEIPSPGTGGMPAAGGAIYRGKPTLTVAKGPLQGQVFTLDPLPVVIGRDPECDLFLNNMTVSRRHAIIEEESERLVLKDLSSLNGTWIDGKITDQAELTDGTLVQIGTFSMRYHS